MTIKDIAREAGVSTAAVSRYFNGGSLGDERRRKIREVVEKNNYVPNSIAKTIRTGKSGHIGVIVPQLSSESLTQIMAGIVKETDSYNYSIILGVSDGKQEKEVHFIDQMQKNKMEGIILMGTSMSPYLKNAIKKCQIPIVVTGQKFSGVPSVFYDDCGAMKAITKKMLKVRDKIAYIGVNESDVAVGKNRRLGVENAISDAGLDKGKMVYRLSEFSVEGGYEAMKDIIESEEKFNGVICATDLIAFGAIKALREAGLKIPKDVSVVGCGNSWADTIIEPGLTTVQFYYEKSGEAAVNVLMEMIESGGKNNVLSQLMLGYTIIERGSV